MKATTPNEGSDSRRARLPLRLLLLACLASALAALTAFSSRAPAGVAGPHALAAFQTPTPLPTPAWRQPTKPNTTYVCDWKRPGASGMSRLSFEYTRQTPGNGWIGRLLTTYANGTRRVDGTQFFAPTFTPRIGTQWRFQTTDGSVTCTFAASRLGSEIKFAGCSNGVEQYCLDERVLTAYESVPDAGCAECRAGGVFERMTCLARCLSRRGGASNPGLCEGRPVQCTSFYFAQNFMGGINWQEGFTRAGLEDLHQNWIDFVNGSLGRCDTSPYLCPVGTSCGNRGDCEQRCRDEGLGYTFDCPSGYKCGGRSTCEKRCTSNSTCPDGSVCGAGGTCEKRSN
jgi:hypothetical protein